MAKKKITTLEDLAVMVQGEFLNFNGRFDRIENSLEEIKIFALENHGRKIEHLEKRIDYIYEVLALK